MGAPVARGHAGSCSAHRRHATATTGSVIVYGRPTGVDPDSGGQLTTYYACLRPAGKPVAVGQSATPGGEYPGNESMSQLHIAGGFVADISGRGFADAAACGKYGASNCQQSITWWVRAADVRSRRSIAVVQPVARPRAVAVSVTGVLAWVQATTAPGAILEAIVLHDGGAHRLTGTPRTLDTGAIGPSLRFTGSTLTWTNAGQPRTQTLG